MEDQTLQTPTPPTQPVMDGMPRTSYHKKRKTGWIITGIVLFILVAAGVWFFFFYHPRPKPLTAAATLQALQASSKPVTATPLQRAAAVNALSQHSATAPTSTNGQLQMLSALSK